jgi:hypothetical protein
MKYILIALLALSHTAQAQITKIDYKTPKRIGQFKRAMQGEVASLEQTDTSYTLRFQNGDYRELVDIQHISFTGAATVTDLYTTLKDCFNKPKGSTTMVTLGSDFIMIRNDKQMGVKMIEFRGPHGAFWATPGQIDKLFGK